MSGSLPGGLAGGLVRRALAPRRRSTTLVGVGGGLRARRVMRAMRTGTSRLACSALGVRPGEKLMTSAAAARLLSAAESTEGSVFGTGARGGADDFRASTTTSV